MDPIECAPLQSSSAASDMATQVPSAAFDVEAQPSSAASDVAAQATPAAAAFDVASLTSAQNGWSS